MADASHTPDITSTLPLKADMVPFFDVDDFCFRERPAAGTGQAPDSTNPPAPAAEKAPLPTPLDDFWYNPDARTAAEEAGGGSSTFQPLPVCAPLESDAGFHENERLLLRYAFLLDPLPIQPVTNSAEFIFDTLSAEFPNFVEALDYICSFVSMARLGQGPVYFPPLLLDGPPGIGKTRFAMRVASLCNAGFDMLSCGGMSGGMALQGSEQGYSESRPGFYAETFRKTKVVNNVILLDEVEKMMTDHRGGDPYAALLPLLEQQTARVHKDNCLQETINLGYLSYILTANSVDTMPEPMMTRVRMVTIQPPGVNDLERIVPHVINDVKACYNLGNYDFVPDMDEIRQAYMANPNIRNLRAIIEYQIRATLWKPRSGRIAFTRPVQKATIGFAR
ncbi:Lon protease [Gluconacetobacter sp. SXCC-1]|nr:AAA family ATPase [Komagataeibacter rhaeticus]ATU71801.1 peptidase [Komagataeibacter xylinus]EGG75767.1 Lon protease [Gluconacetobacter sp. SXCC-1]WPP21483.1 AAA family ATPase [Komagataeibacter rhaeticus]SAY49395.1 Lon protease 1 [Komagataeibacter rhaeticus]